MAELFTEHRTETVKVLESEGDGAFRFVAVVSEADYINGNGRMYPERVLFPAFDSLKANLAAHPGMVDHPDPWEPSSVSDLGIAWEDVYYEGKLVYAKGRIIPTARGKDLQAAMEAGVPIGFSTRGRGIGEEEKLDDRTVYVMKELTLETVADAVINPSVKHARVQSYTKEELATMNEELRLALEAKGVAESKVAELEELLTGARATSQTLVGERDVAVQERDELKTQLEAANSKIAELQAIVDQHAAEAAANELENKIVGLTSEHRFGPAIRDELAEMIKAGITVTLENVEAIVARVQVLVENAAAAVNEGTGKGSFASDEDKETDGLSDADREELELAGLL